MRYWLFILVLFPFLSHGFQVQDSVRVLDEVTIRANRIQTGFNETSANVFIVTSNDIRQAPSLSVSDVLHYVAGVDIRQRGAHGVQADAGIRGSTFDQVLILVNGIKISDPQTGHHSLNLPVDIDNVGRIEILKGPAARVFGQNAFAGAINIVTKNPEENFIKIQATAGDFGLGGFRLGASLKTNGVAHYFSTSRDFSDGYKYNTDYVIANYFYQGSWSNNLGKWNVLAGLSDRSFGANGFYASPAFQDQFESVQTSLMAFSLQTQPRENVSFNHRLYWRRNEDEYIFVRSNPSLYRNLHVNSTVGYEVNAVIKSKAGSTGLGIDANHLSLSSNNLGDRERSVLTMFTEHRFEAGRFDITPGVQYNYYTDFGSNIFPGVDAGFLLNRHVKAYGNFGYTYRVPTYTDLYYTDPVNEGNPDLKPEYAFSYEAGVKFIELHWLSGQASYFKRQGKRIIDWTKEAETDPWRPDNLIGVNMNGWDINFTIRPARQVALINKLDLAYTKINADKVDDGSFSRYALENLRHQVIASLVLNYGAQIKHTVHYRFCDRVTMDDYSLVDSRLSWQGKQWGAFVDVTNIFDVTYRETNLVTMPGRWFKTGISYQLGRQ